MKYLKYYLCIISLLFGVTFFIAAEESDTENETEKSSSSEKASKKSKKKSDNKSSSDSKMLLTAGGGLGINLPAVEIVHDGYNDWNDGDCKTNSFVAFGFNVLANVTFTYVIKADWAIGGSVNLGYNFMGGPHALYEHRYKNEKYQNTYKGFGKLYHSFLADFNFIARSPNIMSNGNLIFEGGVRLMPTWGSTVYRQGGVRIGETAYNNKGYKNSFTGEITYFEYSGKEATMMAGPDLFVGIDYFLNDYLDIIGGLRIGAVFGCADTKYFDAHVTRQSYINSIITIAFEAKINWWKRF